MKHTPYHLEEKVFWDLKVGVGSDSVQGEYKGEYFILETLWKAFVLERSPINWSLLSFHKNAYGFILHE